MSFDLFLRGASLARDGVLNHLDQFPHFERQELTDSAFDYALVDPRTGVYFYLGLEERQSRVKSLSLSLNYNRPAFFALESLPLAESLCRKFDLLLEDPQENTVGPTSVDALVTSWRIHNEAAVKALKAQGMAQIFVPESKANDWWSYTLVAPTIEETFGYSLFVPELLVLRHSVEEPFRMFVAPIAIKQILPPSDFVLIERSNDTESRDKVQRGLISSERFLNLVAPYTTSYRVGKETYPLLQHADHPTLIQLMRNLELTPVARGYERVDPDAYHNVILD